VGALFKGRDEFLEQLRSKVENKVGSALVIATKQTIHGLGGIGKTRLAIEYANRYSEHYNALLFVVADSPENLRANIANLCGALRIDEPDPTKQCDAALKWLQEHPGWFLIVDNVDTKEAAKAVEESILSKLKEGHILVTSRLSGWRNRDLEPLELDVISEDAAIEMLLEGTHGLRRANENDRQFAEKLSKKFGYLPLALQQAVGFISTRRCSIADYLARWENADKKVIEWHDELELKYPRSVATTWELSFNEISNNGKAALSVISWLAPDPIPRTLLEKVPQSSEAIDIEEAIAELGRYSFLHVVDADCQFVQVHSLVSDITRYRMSYSDQKASLQKSIAAASSLIQNSSPQDPRTWPGLYRPCREHFARLIEHAGATEATTQVAGLMNHLGLYLAKIANFSQAESLYRRAIKIYEDSLGPDHIEVADCLNNLAILLADIQQYGDAEPLQQRAFEIRQKIFGPNHPNVGLSLNNVAALWDQKNRSDVAEPLYRRAIEIYKSSGVKNDRTIATITNNLAVLLGGTNRPEEAESMYRQALRMREELYGSNHPEVASSIHDLAFLLESTARHEEVESMYRSALKIREEAYGLSHPDVGQSLHDLAAFLRKKGRNEEAESLFRRALDIRETFFGINHPKIVASLLGLANLLDDIDSKLEAESLFRRALDIRTEVLGPNHPDAASAMMSLGWLLRSTNRHEETEAFFRKAIKIREESPERVTPGIALSYFSLAVHLKETGRRLGEAEDLFRRSIELWEKEYGPKDVTLATVINPLALLLHNTNRLVEAEPLYCQALKILQDFHGPDHLDVATGLCNLALLYTTTDRYEEAERHFLLALEIREKHLGPEQVEVAFVLKEYAHTLRLLNRLDEAESMVRRALAIYESTNGPNSLGAGECLHELSANIRLRSPEQAEAYSRQALGIFDSQMPLDLFYCACVRSVLTRILCSLDRTNEAVVTITDSVKFLHRKRIEAGIGHSVEPVIIENYRETLRKAGISDEEIQQRLIEIAPEFEL
jgi:tetratricopeptide (TPR) repeat protein